MNDSITMDMKDTNKSRRLYQLKERKANELVDFRQQILSDPLERRRSFAQEISGKDPFRNIMPNFRMTAKDSMNDPTNFLERDVNDKLNISRERSASVKRKKESNEANPKFKWEKTSAQQFVPSDDKNPKKTSLSNLKNEARNRSSTRDSMKDTQKKDEKKEVIVVSSYYDLPKKFQRDVENAKIPIESIEQNFFSLLNILHFCDHNTVFLLREGEIERKTSSQKKSVHYDISSKESELLSTGNPKDLFKLGPQLGKGGFGTVYEAKPKKRQKDKIAVKIIPHSSSHQRKYNLREVEYLSKYKHTNIVNLQGAYLQGEELWIVMEHLRGGTLTEARNSHRFTEAQIGYISKHLLTGIKFLHDNGLIHRDIKSQNVMMAVDGTIKLIDFGLCHDTKVFGNVIEMVGSPYWMPPEMIKGEVHSYVADIWSFAICILELANNEAPNRDNKLKAMYTVATVGLPNPLSKPERWSHNFKWFISACLKTNPHERASASDLLSHPFFKDVAPRSAMTEIFSSIFITKALNTFL